VDRAELQRRADRAGIRRTSYSLVGGLPPEQYVLALVQDGWSVYYSERGLRSAEMTFAREEEACDELFRRLVRDPTTRRPESD
jgi:hypothetical protein